MSQEAIQTDAQLTDEASATPGLQVGDIEACIRVIDYAQEQGAFKGWQTVQEVMVLRNRLVSFLRSVPVAVGENAATDNNNEGVPESPASEAQ